MELRNNEILRFEQRIMIEKLINRRDGKTQGLKKSSLSYFSILASLRPCGFKTLSLRLCVLAVQSRLCGSLK